MKHCPNCSTELVSRHDIQVCPRNEIGDCHFDGYEQHDQRVNTEIQQTLNAEGSSFCRFPEY